MYLKETVAARGLAQVAVAAAFALACEKFEQVPETKQHTIKIYHETFTSDLRLLLLFPVHARPRGSAASGPMDLRCLETRGPKLLTSSPSWPAGRWWLQGSRDSRRGVVQSLAQKDFYPKNHAAQGSREAAHQVLENSRKKSKNNILCQQHAAFIAFMAFMAFIACGRNMTGQRNKSCDQHQS